MRLTAPPAESLAFLTLVLILGAGCGQVDHAPSPKASSSPSAGGLDLRSRLGEQHLNARRYGQAHKAFQEALTAREDSVRAYTGIGRTHLAQGDFAESEKALNRAQAMDASRADVSYALAELYLEQHLQTHDPVLLQRALKAARQASRQVPDKSYFYLLGNLYTRSDVADSAEAAYRQALALDPGLATAYERLGHLYRVQGRLAEAEKAYQKQVDLQPENARALCDLALLHRTGGRPAEARALLEKAVDLDPVLGVALLNLGQLYLAEGSTEAGEIALERFRQLNENDMADLLARAEARPRDADAQRHLADSFAQTREFRDRAEPLYHKAIQLDGGLVAAYTGLGRLYLLQNRFEEAEHILQQVQEKEASLAEVYVLLGETYLRQDRPDTAVPALERAAKLDTSSLHARQLLADAYRLSGQYQKEQQARKWIRAHSKQSKR